MRFRISCAFIALLVWTLNASAAAVFQYSVPVETAKGASAAFLWLPHDAVHIRGLIVAGMTLAERDIVEDARIRKACADEQLAILFLKCGLAAVDIQKVLDDASKLSGYEELAKAPLFFIGHSAGGPQAKALAIKMVDRCFGLVQYRGGVPGGDDSVPAGVPVLMMIGQFDEFGKVMRDATGRETWEGGRDGLVAWRLADEKRLGTVIVEPGAGHFAWSDRNAVYLVLFIRKAAAARIPSPAAGQPPVSVCKEIDPKSGWLSDSAIKVMTDSKPAPYDKYIGDKAKANWHLDEELAKATQAYHAGISGKADQFIHWTDAAAVDAGVRYFFTNLKWIDAQTIEVHPVYATEYPKTGPDGPGPRWAQAGKPAGHAAVPIHVRPVGAAPLIAVDGNAFRMSFNALAPAGESARPTFVAFSEGDEKYRYTEQVGMMPRGFNGLTRGKAQTITFPPISDLKQGEPVELSATSDSGLPVEYYVASGPATIENGKLRITEVPRRCKFPIEVKVVAWQFGSAVEPLVKTAALAEQSTCLLQR